MNKITIRIMTFFLALIMCSSVIATAMPVSAKIVITEDDYSPIPDLGFEIIDIIPSAPSSGIDTGFLKSLCGGALKMLAGRAVEELTAFVIANDIPGLSKFLFAIQSPAQRAAIKQKKMVADISQRLIAIDASLKRIEDQLNDISNKLDQYATAEDFKTAIQHLNEIASQYKAAWSAYQKVLDEMEILAGLQEKKEAATDPNVIATLETQIETADYNVQVALNSFVTVMEEGGGYKFAADLEDISIRIWNPSNPSSSYLGAYEAYLRERFPFEHQISGSLREAFESCTDIQSQIFTLYKEYYTYKRALEPDSPAYKAYTDEYFDAVNYALVKNLDAMSTSTGFAECMLPKAMSEDELKDIKEYDADFVEPENINSSVIIGDQKYDCYKIRDNKDLSYYLILKDFISADNMVECYQTDYVASRFPDRHIHRPHWMLDNLFTDNYQYTMVSDFQEMTAIKDWKDDVLSRLRSVNECGLTDLPEQTEYFMLYINSVNIPQVTTSTVHWTMNFIKARDVDADKVSINTRDMPDGYDNCLVVYKSVNSAGTFINGTWTVNDRGEVANKTVVVEDGETLDMSQMSTNPTGVTICVKSGATVISNPAVTLEDSVLIYADDVAGSVTLKNLNIKAADHQEFAFVIKSGKADSNLKVCFDGKNTFTGNASAIGFDEIFKYQQKGKPVGVSHGIYIPKDSKVYFSKTNDGKLYAYGAGGGAGICIDGYLKSEGLDIVAEGSQISTTEKYIEKSDYWIYSVGAGIGTSLSCVYHYAGSRYTVYGGKQIDYVGVGEFQVSGGLIKATGKSSGLSSHGNPFGKEIYSEDIGGVNIPATGAYYGSKGGFSNATVDATRAYIGKNYTTKAQNNTFVREMYTIETYTAGTNGVTTEGISFKANGDSEDSGWINASSCGNEKGTWNGSFNGKGIKNMESLSVKTNSSNHWWPGKITVKQQFSGNEITVYGGRWIGNTEKVLKLADVVYELNVKTGNENNSGTDANIKVYLRDENKLVTNTVDLSDIHWDSNAFEKGDDSTFWIYAPDKFSECRQVYFSSDYANSAAGWLLKSFSVKKVSGPNTDGGYSFTADQWFEEARTIAFGKKTGETGAFYIEVQTDDITKAGTDSNIYLTIHGSNGSTGSINLGTYAGGNNNFEKGDLDCFEIGYDVAGIGTIRTIEIKKDNSGSGPDWYPEYIIVTEKLADGNKAQSVQFIIDEWIENSTYSFTLGDTLSRSAPRIDSEILKNLKQNEDGSYTLTVDRDVNINESVFELLKEKKIKANIIMTNKGKPIYEVCFDGNEIKEYNPMTLQKGHSITDGKTVLDFVTGVTLPAGTTVKVYTENIGFFKTDKLIVMSKDENGEWNDSISAIGKDGELVFTLEEGKELLINRINNPSTGDGAYYAVYVMFALTLIVTVLFRRKVWF